ncbi:MAG TPA: hypothetical protein VJT33_00385 [bacterium]|nr:hypothetical protein [bacterium]
MAIMAISVSPIGTGSTGVGDFVADALRVVERTMEAKVRSARACMTAGR